MKKAIILFCLVMSLFTTSAFAQLQEVRGIETRLVEYIGNSYSLEGVLVDENIPMYGFELHNTNSITVSVDIELYYKSSDGDKLVTTKSVTLKPGETYIFKQEKLWTFIKKEGRINNYYIRYKAYKVQ